MLRRDISIYPLVLILFLCFTSSLQAQEKDSIPSQGRWSWEYSYPRELRDPLASLYLHLMTRPGVTAESDVKLLIPVTHEAAACFRKSLFQGSTGILKQARFTKEVNTLDQAYLKEYANAPEGIAGAEARGAALDRLLDGLLLSAGRSGIPLEDFDLALLHGCAAIEKRISQRPLSSKLSETDRELIQYLLRFIVHQERRRILLDSTRGAFHNVGAADEIRTFYDSRIYQVLRPTLSREPIGLETFLADPLNLDDQQKIITAEYNLEASSDLFGIKYGMELPFVNFDGIVSPLQDSLISTITDRIPGMNPEILKEQLKFAHSLGLPPLAAYASIPPALPITYSPLSGLADRLAMLGETPPDPPDFSLFTGTYRALFQLNYDILLSDLITAREWSIADNNNPDPTRPLSLADQYAVKVSAMKRSAMIRTRIRGVSEQTSRTVMTLFRLILVSRI
jgi:hypothetical protein